MHKLAFDVSEGGGGGGLWGSRETIKVELLSNKVLGWDGGNGVGMHRL